MKEQHDPITQIMEAASGIRWIGDVLARGVDPDAVIDSVDAGSAITLLANSITEQVGYLDDSSIQREELGHTPTV